VHEYEDILRLWWGLTFVSAPMTLVLCFVDLRTDSPKNPLSSLLDLSEVSFSEKSPGVISFD